MSDAQTEDARPLTKEERAQLADCLFLLCSAIHHNHKIQNQIILSLRNNAGIDVDSPNMRGLFAHDMSKAIELIEKLTKNFGVSANG
jgi:hypothetical protein